LILIFCFADALDSSVILPRDGHPPRNPGACVCRD
jgi:hypothetical protein